MSHFEEFGKLIEERLSPAKRRLMEAPGHFDRWWDTLMWELRPLEEDVGAESPNTRPPVELSEDERNWLHVQAAYLEVAGAVERLKLAEACLRRPRSSRWLRSEAVLRTVYVAYHVENYIQEMYILEDRVRRLIAKVKGASTDQTAVDQLAEALMPRLRLFRELRRIHVHEQRLQRPQARALRALEVASGSNASLRRDAARALRLHRSRWANETERWSHLLGQLLDYLFGELTRVVQVD